MASPIAEAFVRIRADTTGFEKDLEQKVRGAVGSVVPGQLQLPVGGGGASAAAGVAAANQQIAASAALVTNATAAEAAALANVQAATVALERATTNVAKVRVAAGATSKEIAQAELLEAAADNRLTAAKIRLAEVTAARAGVASGLVAANQAIAASSVEITATSAAEAAASAAVRNAKIGLIAATEALAAVQANAGASAAELARAELAVGVAEDRLTAANLRLAASGELVNNSFLRNKNLSRTALQPALVGLGQGALSSRIAFFSLQGAAVALAGTGFLLAVKGAANLEQSLNTLQAVTQATAGEIQVASDVAKQLGADITLPAVSATDAAEAILTLTRSGIELQDSIAGARGVLQLAAAAQTDNASAAIITARALNAFNLAGSEATRVADLLTGSSIAGGASIQEMAVALQQAASAASAISVPLEDTTNALALLARNGLAGSDAGTSLRTALLRMNPQTKEARDLVAALGVEVFDAQGNFVGLPAAIDQYSKALQGLSEETRQAALQTIFGQDAFRAIALLTREGSAGFDEIAATAEREGIAAEIAAARTSGLNGALSALASNLQTVGVEIGEKFIPALTGLVNFLNDVTTAAGAAVKALERLGDVDIPGAGTVGDIASDFFDKAKIFASPPPVNAFKGIKAGLDEIRGSSKDAGEALSAFDRIAIGLTGATAPTLAIADALRQVSTELRGRFTLPNAKGLLEPGNLDILHRKIAVVGDDIATVASITVGTDRGTAVIPTVIEGQLVSIQEAINHFKQTNENLGIFDNLIDAEQFSQRLHEQQQKLVGGPLEQLRQVLAKNGIAIGSDFSQKIMLGLEGVHLDDAAGIIRELRIQATTSGKDIGEQLGLGIADGLISEQTAAVAAARETLNQVIQEADRAITESVASAKRNLISIGNELGQEVERLIEDGPIGRRIQALQDRLDRMRRGSTKSGLQFNLREARRDLVAAQQSIFTVGTPTAQQQTAINAFLDPFKQKVKDAQSEIDEFTVEGVLKKQQDAADTLKDSVSQGIDDLIIQYNQGAIKLGALQKGIAAQLRRAGITHYQNAGKALGEAFADAFNKTIAGLITQATTLAKGPHRPGSGQEPTQVDTIRAAAEQAARVDAARLQLQTEQKTLQKEQRDAQRNANIILREIRNRLPKPQTKPTAVVAGDSDHKHVVGVP